MRTVSPRRGPGPEGEGNGDDRPADGPPRGSRRRPVSRREALGIAALGVAGLAGCSSGGPAQTRLAAETGTQVATGRPSAVGCAADTAVERDGPLTTEFDARAAFRCLGEPLDSVERPERWSVLAGEATVDERRAVTGSRSMYLRAAADDDRVWVERAFPNGVDLSDRNVSLSVHFGFDTPTGIYVQLLAPDENDRVDMWHAPGQGGWFRIDPGPTNVVGQPDLTDVTRVGIGAWAGDREVDFWVDSVRTTAKPDGGYVTFTFDDNLASQYEVAYPVLQERGYAGVVGTIPHTVGNTGWLSRDQLGELHAAGWDVVNHPQESEPLTAFTRSRLTATIERTKRWLLDEGFEDGARFVIWPYGAADRETLDVASNYYYLGFGGGQTTSGFPFTDPLTVARFDGNDVERSKRLLELAAGYRTLAVPMYHAIGDDGISREAFEEVVALVDDLGLTVVTASDLWDEHLPTDRHR